MVSQRLSFQRKLESRCFHALWTPASAGVTKFQDNNPPDGSNWELLCRYCHDNEHARYTDAVLGEGMTLGSEAEGSATFRPFADLKAKLKREG